MGDVQVIKYKVGKTVFELLTKVGSVQKWRDGKLGLDNVLVTDVIWKNHSKGERANAAELKSSFGTEVNADCVSTILTKGEVPVSQAERKEKVEKKRNEIINYLNKYYIDPKSGKPHPVTRIGLALDEMKARVDPDIAAERQVSDLIRKLVEVIPLKKSEIEGTLIIPNKVMGQASGVVHKWANVRSERYTSEGCQMEIALTPGDYDTFISDLHKVTKGEFQFDMPHQSGPAQGTSDGAEKGGKKGKKGGKGKKGRK